MSAAGREHDLAMFPLGVAHMPGDDVVLRVFEARYVAMCRTLLADDASEMVFGSVLILRGSEVGGGDLRAGHGVEVHITEIAATDEGGYVIVGRADSRFEVVQWLPDDPYPRATVSRSSWPESGSVADRDALDRLVRAAQMTRLLLVDAARVAHIDLLMSAEQRARLGSLASGHVEGIDARDALWLVARSIPCGPTDRLAILSAGNLEEAVATLERVVEHVREVLAFRLSGP